MEIILHHPCGMDLVGFIPSFLFDTDPRPAREQFNERYAHGGGWSDFQGFTLTDANELTYPGDPAYVPRATLMLREETIVVYDHAWVAIIQPDRSFSVCRMD